jgi:hypothetical protein
VAGVRRPDGGALAVGGGHLAKSAAKREVGLGRRLRRLPACEAAWLAVDIGADDALVASRNREMPMLHGAPASGTTSIGPSTLDGEPADHLQAQRLLLAAVMSVSPRSRSGRAAGS